MKTSANYTSEPTTWMSEHNYGSGIVLTEQNASSVISALAIARNEVDVGALI